ncbi:MAG: DUF1800 domain-containing protein [Acidimicrobiales bacterium]
MADQTRSRIAHLYRRAGFGATPAQLDDATAKGYEATVDGLLDLNRPDPRADSVTPPSFTDPTADPLVQGGRVPADPAARKALQQRAHDEGRELVMWWLDRMVAAERPLAEKLTLIWHGHFATSIEKVRAASFMYRQNELFRSLGAGSFEALTQAVAKDPAMLVWLDSSSNVARSPNENFARELMELFTLGIGNYTEDDVKAAARCFTGWKLNRRTGTYSFAPAQHDHGQKTVLGHTGDLNGEDVITLLTRHPVSARFVVARLWSHFARPVATDDPVVADLAQAYAGDLDVAKLLRAMFLHPEFTSPAVRTGLVRTPIEWLVGALRALGLWATDPALDAGLRQLGQVPFQPPNVGGWPQNAYWLTTASTLGRLRLAARLAVAADLSALSTASKPDRPDLVARLLSLDGWSPTTASALAGAAGDPRALVTLSLVSPEFLTN